MFMLVSKSVLKRDGGVGDTYETRVADELASEPQEGLLEVVVGLGGDIVVLEVLLAVESDRLCLDLALLHVDLVAAENDWDVLAHTDEITWKQIVKSKIIQSDSWILEYSRCQLGTFLYVIREVTSNMMIPHWPLM